jgi:hypothetical protein
LAVYPIRTEPSGSISSRMASRSRASARACCASGGGTPRRASSMCLSWPTTTAPTAAAPPGGAAAPEGTAGKMCRGYCRSTPSSSRSIVIDSGGRDGGPGSRRPSSSVSSRIDCSSGGGGLWSPMTASCVWLLLGPVESIVWPRADLQGCFGSSPHPSSLSLARCLSCGMCKVAKFRYVFE